MMNQLCHTIRKFNRFELKYVITLKQAEQFKLALRSYLIPDEHGDNGGRYSLTSLYYDSPDFHCYREKMDGLRFRRKLRIRRYETGEPLMDETPVFVEIKQRIDRVMQKRRAVLPYRDALYLCNDRQIPDHTPRDKAVIEEIYTFLWHYNLRPASIVRYERQAFVGTEYDMGLRVTFDTSLTSQIHPLQLHASPSGLSILPPSLTVMEIKANERIPYWLTELISAHNLQMMRISKYCCSIEAGLKLTEIHGPRHVADWRHSARSSSFSIFNLRQRKLQTLKQ